MIPLVRLVAATGLAAAATAIAVTTCAAQPPAGATACSGCHAPAGRVSVPSIPPLDGLRGADIAQAMADYRSGERPGTVMGRIATGFTAAEALAIGEWLERQRAERQR